MDQETLKKAIELNRELEELSKLSMHVNKEQSVPWYFTIGCREINNVAYYRQLTTKMKEVFTKAVNEAFAEIKKEIEAL